MTDLNLRPLGVEGFIGFSIKAKDTDHNQMVHDGFKQYARDECDSDYTQSLKRLLELAETDWKYESLLSKISDLEDRVAVLEAENLSKDEKEIQEDSKPSF